MNSVLKLHRRGVLIAEIARRLSLSTADVTRIIVADRESRTPPTYEPSEEEIYAEAAKLREKMPRHPVGHPPQEVEVMRSTAAPLDHRPVKGRY